MKKSIILLPLIFGLAFSGVAYSATVKGVVNNQLPVATKCVITTETAILDTKVSVSPTGSSTVSPQAEFITRATYEDAGSQVFTKLATERITLTTGGSSIFVGTIKYKIGNNTSENGKGLYAQWVPQNSNNYASFIKVSASKQGSNGNGKKVTIKPANNESTSCSL